MQIIVITKISVLISVLIAIEVLINPTHLSNKEEHWQTNLLIQDKTMISIIIILLQVDLHLFILKIFN